MPGSLKVAVVISADGSANATLPGPDFLLQRTVGGGPAGAGGVESAAAPRLGDGLGGSPYPAHARKYVLPGNTTTRSTPATPLTAAVAAARAGRIAALSTGGRTTEAAAAFPIVPSIARRLMPDSGV